MTTSTLSEKTLWVSAPGTEPVELQLQGTEPLTIRIEVQAPFGTGSYTDMEPPSSRRGR
jgi:hypothetical protein